jgi:hypothetical protein
MDTAQALKPDTVIGQQYIILAVEDHDGLCWRYRGKDLDGRTILDILEYFPAGSAARRPDGAVAAASEGAADTYQTGCKQFLARAQTLAGLARPGLAAVRQPVGERGTVYAVVETVEGPTLLAWATERSRPPTQIEIDHTGNDRLATWPGAHLYGASGGGGCGRRRIFRRTCGFALPGTGVGRPRRRQARPPQRHLRPRRRDLFVVDRKAPCNERCGSR